MVYYGLSLNTPNLYGDMYINFFIGQMVEIPSVTVTMWIIYRYLQTFIREFGSFLPFISYAHQLTSYVFRYFVIFQSEQ